MLTLAFGRVVAAQDVPTAFFDAWQSAAARKSQWSAFADKHAKHDLGRLAKLFHGIELLKAGKDGATTHFQFQVKKEGASILHKQVAFAGSGWQARVRMADLGVKLKAYHRKRVEYPTALKDLAAAGFVKTEDLIDPFGKPFAYEAKPRRLMPDVPRQTYTLRCTSTGAAMRQLNKTLRDLYDPLAAVQVTSLKPELGQAFVRFMQEDGSFSGARRWRPGEKQNGLMLWAVYDRYIIVGRADVPKVATLP